MVGRAMDRGGRRQGGASFHGIWSRGEHARAIGAGLGVEAAVAIGRMTLFGELTLRGRTRKHGENLPHGPARHELWADAQLGVRAGQWGITGWVQPYAQANRKVLGDAPAHRTELTGGVALQWRPFVQKRPVQDASAASAPSSP